MSANFLCFHKPLLKSQPPSCTVFTLYIAHSSTGQDISPCHTHLQGQQPETWTSKPENHRILTLIAALGNCLWHQQFVAPANTVPMSSALFVYRWCMKVVSRLVTVALLYPLRSTLLHPVFPINGALGLFPRITSEACLPAHFELPVATDFYNLDFNRVTDFAYVVYIVSPLILQFRNM